MEPPNTTVLETTIRYGVRAAWQCFCERLPDPDQRELALTELAAKVEQVITGEGNDLVALGLFYMLAFLCETNTTQEKPQ